jgi:hypothetical protein
VAARNEVGLSILSAATTVKAATVPDAPALPTVLDQQPSFVEFSWLTPYDGYDAIIDYKIMWD